MTKNRIVFAIGIILFLMPLLGFTTYQKNFFLLVFGAALVTLSFSQSISKRNSFRKIKNSKKNASTSVFVDGHGSFTVPEPTEEVVPTEEPVQPKEKEEPDLITDKEHA